jgi:hypothetical protein
MGTLIWKVICENPRAENILMVDFADCVDNGHCHQWAFPVMGRDKFVTWLCMETRGTFSGELTAVRLDMVILTSKWMILPIFAASSLTDNF